MGTNNKPDQATYERLTRAIADEPKPCAVVDLAAFDRNVSAMTRAVTGSGKTIRIASKSIRCVPLMRRFFEQAGPLAQGVMSYSAYELPFLFSQGFDDLLLAYPIATNHEANVIAKACADGARISVAVDHPAHLELLQRAAVAMNVRIRVVVDVDLSLRPLGDRVHLGVRRSPLHSADDVIALAEQITRYTNLTLVGVLAYEAHIAGITDNNPFSPALNAVKAAIRQTAKAPVARERAAIVDGFSRRSLPLEVFNGGGTGSVDWSARDPSLTEVTIGSGLLAGHLFGYYRESVVEPAAYFALSVTRLPTTGIVTCHGGGYVASGEAGRDRLPVPVLPAGLRLLDIEGAGEVQTPLAVPRTTRLTIGDTVLFRHAKAGELSEHFAEYLVVDGEQISDRALTYRGMGKKFV